MMNEIYARGPLTCSMATPEDFDYGGLGSCLCTCLRLIPSFASVLEK